MVRVGEDIGRGELIVSGGRSNVGTKGDGRGGVGVKPRGGDGACGKDGGGDGVKVGTEALPTIGLPVNFATNSAANASV